MNQLFNVFQNHMVSSANQLPADIPPGGGTMGEDTKQAQLANLII
jgi:hypothetical protein